MNELRWILLIVGILVLVAIYLLGRKEHARRRRRREEEEIGTDTAGVWLDTREHDDIAPPPERFDELEGLVQEDAGARPMPPAAPTVETQPGTAVRPGSRPEPNSASEPVRAKPERPHEPRDKIISLYVVARRPSVLSGRAILHAAESLNLEYGDMQIFNRVVERNGRRYIVFSMANAVQPGTFDLEELPNQTTPGLALFMQLPGPLEGLKAFNAMLDCAQRLSTGLDAELLDESRSVLNNQTIDHLREEIQLHSLRTARQRPHRL